MYLRYLHGALTPISRCSDLAELRGVLTVETFDLGHGSNITSAKSMSRSSKEEKDRNRQHSRRRAKARHGCGIIVLFVVVDYGGSVEGGSFR